MKKTIYLGKNIDYLLKEKKMQQSELATITGKTRACVSSWIHKDVIPTIDIILFLSDYFSVTTDELFFLDLSNHNDKNTKYLINKFLNSVTIQNDLNISIDDTVIDDFHNLLHIVYKKRP